MEEPLNFASDCSHAQKYHHNRRCSCSCETKGYRVRARRSCYAFASNIALVLSCRWRTREFAAISLQILCSHCSVSITAFACCLLRIAAARLRRVSKRNRRLPRLPRFAQIARSTAHPRRVVPDFLAPRGPSSSKARQCRLCHKDVDELS